MAPITWRNVAAPSFGEAINGVTAATGMFNKAFEGMGDIAGDMRQKQKDAASASAIEKAMQIAGAAGGGLAGVDALNRIIGEQGMAGLGVSSKDLNDDALAVLLGQNAKLLDNAQTRAGIASTQLRDGLAVNADQRAAAEAGRAAERFAQDKKTWGMDLERAVRDNKRDIMSYDNLVEGEAWNDRQKALNDAMHGIMSTALDPNQVRAQADALASNEQEASYIRDYLNGNADKWMSPTEAAISAVTGSDVYRNVEGELGILEGRVNQAESASQRDRWFNEANKLFGGVDDVSQGLAQAIIQRNETANGNQDAMIDPENATQSYESLRKDPRFKDLSDEVLASAVFNMSTDRTWLGDIFYGNNRKIDDAKIEDVLSYVLENRGAMEARRLSFDRLRRQLDDGRNSLQTLSSRAARAQDLKNQQAYGSSMQGLADLLASMRR